MITRVRSWPMATETRGWVAFVAVLVVSLTGLVVPAAHANPAAPSDTESVEYEHEGMEEYHEPLDTLTFDCAEFDAEFDEDFAQISAALCSRPLAQIASSSDHSLALDANGTLWAWGANWHGQLGDGTTTYRHRPVPVSGQWGSRQIAQIVASSDHSLALMTDGTLWSWGGNSLGQLGDGTTTNRSRPVRVSANWGSRQIAQVDAGFFFSLVLMTDGTVWDWGANVRGLPDPDRPLSYSTRPVQVPASWGTQRITQVSASSDHSLALDDLGRVWAWGANWNGELGDGGATYFRNHPVQVTGGWGTQRITQVAAGYFFSLALANDGIVWSWGANWNGRLGDGSTSDRFSPVRVSATLGSARRITRITANSDHSMATANDGTVWAWGANWNGQLGDGTRVDRHHPVRVVHVGPPRFADVPIGASFFNEIQWLAQTGITGGYSDCTFRPQNNVHRGAMAAFLYRLAGPWVTATFQTPATARFRDVPRGAPFFREIEWLASTGITAGYADGTFRPQNNVHRGAMAAFLYRLAGSEVTATFQTPATARFRDVPRGAPFFRQIEWMAANGISTGYADGTFRPQINVHRGAMATFMHRLASLT